MKKSFFILIFFFLTISPFCHGQIQVGTKLGLNLATWSLDPSISGGKESAILPHGGVFGVFGINSMLSLQPEVLFNQKGVRLADNVNNFAFKISHIEVPLLLRFAFGNQEIKGFILGGPFVGYALSQTSVTKQNGKVIFRNKVPFDNDLEDDGVADRRIDAGWALGAGVQFATGTGQLFAEVRYDYSLTGLIKYKDYTPDTVLRNKVLMLSLGYIYTLKK